jgi:PiT family inorganic phosphate transporter
MTIQLGLAIAFSLVFAFTNGFNDAANALGVLVALAVSPPLGLAFGLAFVRSSEWLLRRATRRLRGPVRGAQWVMSAVLSFSHGANDGQKSMGAIAAALLASGRLHAFSVPLWAKLACGAALTLGTALAAGGSFAPLAAASST